MPPPPRSRRRAWAINLALLAASTAATLALVEATFRLLVPAGDIPENVTIDTVVKYVPGQRGIYRVRDEIAAPFAINANGWNSGHDEYTLARAPGKTRIVVIGDSYVEALQVPFDRSLAEQLEQSLGRDRADVYRFGISGAPLSQYLWILEREALAYRPDVVVVVLIHNDFDESFRMLGGRYASAFMKLQLTDREIVEVAPQPFAPTWQTRLLQWSATLRFLRYRQKLDLANVYRRVTGSSGRAATDVRSVADGVDEHALAVAMPAITRTAEYLIGRLARLVREHGGTLVFMMDGARAAVYEERDSPVRALNRLAAVVAARHGAVFIDLDQVFADDWRRAHRRFEFQSDAHWNEHGHAVAAQAIAAIVQGQGMAR